MDHIATDAQAGCTGLSADERRRSTRYASLIRAAKIVSGQGEFVCVIRDVSEDGIGLKIFHMLPPIDRQELVLQNGLRYQLDMVRSADDEASFTFAEPVDVQELIVEASVFPRRPLRIEVCVPATVSTLTQQHKAVIHNCSQQGVRLECDAVFAIEQPLWLEAAELPELGTKVRWRRNRDYGLAFDTTFSLRELALKVAALQCPSLLAR